VGGTTAGSSSSQSSEGGNTGGRSTSGGSASATGGTTSSAGGSTSLGGSTGTAGGTGGTTSKGGQGGSASTSASAGRTGGSTGAAGQTASTRPIAFGTFLNAQGVIDAAQTLAKSLANPSGSQWQAKGDQHRTYKFAEANATEPYRLYVPTTWDGKAKLPLVMFLHGAGNDESSYIDQNSKQMITLAQQHGFILVGPLGASSAYGNFLRLTAPFGNQSAADGLMSQVTAETERANELSEKDVINVLELVLNEYPVDRGAVFLTGHSMGSGGTWLIGGKYASYWTAIAPMSGPFVQETGYPWDNLRNTPIFVTEGTQAPSLDASHLLRDWLKKNDFKSEYKEVNADHPGMVPLVLPDVFTFFDKSKTTI
jgi:predicted esterase